MSARTITVENTSRSGIHSVSFTFDGSAVVAGDSSDEIRQWNVADARQAGPAMKANGAVYSAVVSRNGRWIVTGDLGSKVTVWSATTHEKVLEIDEHTDYVRTVDIASDSSRIASGSDDGTVRIFNIATGRRLIPPLDHADVIAGVKFSGNGGKIATATYFASVRVYDSHTGDQLFDIQLQVTISGISPLAWSSDNQNLFFVSPGKITSLDTVVASAHSEWLTHNHDCLASIVTDGNFIACSAGPSVSFWDVASHKQIGPILEHTADIECIALPFDSRYLACGHGDQISVHNLTDILPNTYFNEQSFIAPHVPLMEVSDAALESWIKNEFLAGNTEAIISQEITQSLDPSHHALANRALVRARLSKWTAALDDAKMSLRIQLSPIGHIAMAIARCGQGDEEGALRALDLAFRDCDPKDIQLLLLLKSIILFQSGRHEDAILRIHDLVVTANDREAYCFMQVLGGMCLKKGEALGAKEWFEHAQHIAPSNKRCPNLTTISLIFGKGFEGPELTDQQELCEKLYTESHAKEAAEMLLSMRQTIAETKSSLKTMDWFNSFTEKCIARLDLMGDEAYSSEEYSNAILQYSAALSLEPASPAGILVKRSVARSAMGMWEEALQDTDELIRIDPNNHLCYQRRYAALYAARRYDEAIEAFSTMLSLIERSHDLDIRLLRKKYISPSQTTARIDQIVQSILKISPLVLIDVNTGRLCDGAERMRIFKSDPAFKELVSSMTTIVDDARILQVVSKFFGYAMLSHVWEGKEPTFQDVNLVQSIHDLEKKPLNDKIRRFCEEARKLGHRWAWADTCCIDKTTSSILTQSLTSMHKWYSESSVTLVLLVSVKSPSKVGDLANNLWMTRAWTLQELLSSKTVRFYDCEWKPYLGDTRINHKESSEIVQELSDAFQIPREHILVFNPDDLGVRDKLRLASQRNATIEEDVAYSLIGIFKSDIRPQYGEGEAALGHLLEEIVARSGEVSILAWTGRSSSYNSCLPATLAVYAKTPYAPPAIALEDMQARIAQRMSTLPRNEAIQIYRRVSRLPPARFANRRLHLPCIIFPIKKLSVQELGSSAHRYRVKVSGLGIVDVITVDVLPKNEPRRLVLVHPWISDIRGPRTTGVTWDEDSDSDSNSGSDSEWEKELGSGHGSDAEWLPSESSASNIVASDRVDEYNLALKLIVRLGEPFNALLLLQQPGGEYHRVATENEIVVKGPGSNINPAKDIRAEVLEIL